MEEIITNEVSAFIYEGNIEKLQKDVAKMNKRADKLGCAPIIVDVTDEEEFRSLSGRDKDPKYRFVKVNLIGQTPKLSEWQLVACCDHDAIIGQTVREVPNMKMPIEYRDGSTYCGHCNSNRFRLKTYIVWNSQTGETKRVGSTCIKDFLGHKAAESFLFYASFVSLVTDLEETYKVRENLGSEPLYYDLANVLAITVKCIAENGYWSRKRWQESEEEGTCPTSTSVFAQLHPTPYYLQNGLVYEITDEDLAAVEPMIEWAKNLPETSEYNLNLKKMAMAGVTKGLLMGFAVSIVPSYMRAMEQTRERARKKPSEHVGEIGERLTIQLHYTHSASTQTQFGTCFFHKFEDKDGNLYSWSTSKEMPSNKSWFTVTGTVKNHETFNKTKTTIITRCVLAASATPFWK